MYLSTSAVARRKMTENTGTHSASRCNPPTKAVDTMTMIVDMAHARTVTSILTVLNITCTSIGRRKVKTIPSAGMWCRSATGLQPWVSQ